MNLSLLILIIVALAILTVLSYLIADYLGPQVIQLKTDTAFGINCLRTKDLIVQEFDREGNLWATRGLTIYKMRNGENKLSKIARLPSGFSLFWLNNFSLFRKITLRSECIEMIVAEDGSICAFSSGNMWNNPEPGGRFLKTMILPHFGKGIGRGIMSTGLLLSGGKNFFFGEYFNNPERTSVKVFNYNNTDQGWVTSYEFLPGQIRHIHSLQRDPYTGKLWICTGDEDNEPMIGWSDDNYKTIIPIGQGSQIWRACQLVFTEEAVFWGTDTGSEDTAGIYCWNKISMELTYLHKIAGAIFFCTRLSNGKIIMSSDREGFPNEKDDKTRLYILSEENNLSTIPCGTWKYRKPGFRFNFAKLRFQRNQGNKMLAVSVLNQKEFPDGEMLIFNEEDLCASY